LRATLRGGWREDDLFIRRMLFAEENCSPLRRIREN